MLGFFQKYQRFFFIFVTVMVVASFAFFGVFDTFANQGREEEDFQLGETVDGSPLMRLEVARLSRFIATDAMDFSSSTPNFCNDGVIRNDLLRTGLSDLIVATYFDSLKEDLQQRLGRAKRFRGYEHPEATFISSRAVWDRFLPSIGQELDHLRAQENPSVETFSHLSRLYQQQSACPPEFLKRVLGYYLAQASWVKPDHNLQYADLSLFGFHSVSDWFGSNFVDVSAQFILNAAKCAEEKGIRVSLEEAKADLLRNFQTSMQKMNEMKNPQGMTFGQHLHSLGLDEKKAAEAWRSVLLFRRYFHGVAEATFVDQMPYREFASFAKDTSVVQKYEWPESLQLKTADDLIEFQVYLHSIGGSIDSLSLPSKFLSLEEVEKKTPELAQTTFRMKVAKVSLAEAGLRAQMKEVLDLELDEGNWDLLAKEFSFLEKKGTKEERFLFLETLSSEQKRKVDLFARLAWAKKNGQCIDALLESATREEKTISIAKDWISLPGISNPRELCALLEEGGIVNYSDQGNVFYRFSEIEKVTPLHILTFEEARELGVMEQVADRFLEGAYKKLQKEESDKRLFSSIKEEAATVVFSKLLQKMGGEHKPLAYYAAHRLEMQTKEALNSLSKNSEDPEWVGVSKNPLADQFKLRRAECLVQRTTKDEWMRTQVLIMMPKEWSPVYVPADGKITFFYFEKSQKVQEPILEQISFGREVIGADAQRYVAKTLLVKAKQKKSIVIPIHSKDKE